MIRTVKHLCFTIKCNPVELESIVDQIDRFYYEKATIKKDDFGNPKIKHAIVQNRVLNPSINRLKALQKTIQRKILTQIPLPEYAFGGTKGRDNIRNARVHQGKKHIFTTDLADFFPSVKHTTVFHMYLRNGFSPSTAHYLTRLTTYKGRIPQGAPTSSTLANLVFVPTGLKLLEFARKHDITFTSFIDDMTFSSAKDFKHLVPEILAIIKDGGFKISHKKTNYKTKLPKVTGVTVKNNGLDVPKSFIEKMQDPSLSKASVEGKQRYVDRVRRA